MHRVITSVPCLAAILCLTGSAWSQQVEPVSFILENGMKFLLLPRTEQPNSISACWLAKVGSVNERPGITGMSHFFEHMMFKGTSTIGTTDPELDRELSAQQQAVKAKLNKLAWGQQYERWRLGDIDDPFDPAHDTEDMKELRAELNRLIEAQAEITVMNEFDEVYTKLGGSGMNAFTANDLTLFFITVPSNKFELWAWMESDRLNDSIFREFYAERDVVHEERRLSTESTPTGIFQEQFEAMFWQSSPYSWPVLGWPTDLSSYTVEQAQNHFDTYYRANNLVGVVVGDFKIDQVKPIIQTYFGRLERSSQEPPPVVTLEMPQVAEKRMYAECDCQPQIEIRYHTVPFNHADSFALEVMAQILNGRTGRLYKSLVEGKEIASRARAFAFQFGAPWKYAGSFSFSAETKGQAVPEDLEDAWYEELHRLQSEPVDERELQKVKNQVVANTFRSMRSNMFIMIQLGYYESLGGWEFINESPRKLTAVTAEDIQRVANEYFESTNRTVGIYRRKPDAAPIDPELAALEPRAQAMVHQAMEQLSRYDLENLRMVVAQMQAQTQQAPPDFKPAMDYLIKKLKERIVELEAAEADQK